MSQIATDRATEHAAIALGAGIVFAVGLAIAGMTIPANVVGFLDVFGDWKPQLAFVMMGAIAVHAPIYWLLVRRRSAPPFAVAFDLPTRRDVDARLVAGAAIFGAGWGIGGFCPGPAVVSLATGALEIAVFVGAMALGMVVFNLIESARADG